MIVLKPCSKCKALMELNDVNFNPRAGSRKGWHSACRECESAVDRARYEARVGHPAHHPARPSGPVGGKSAGHHEAASRRHDDDLILPLIRAYEAVRTVPCPARRDAERLLGLALSRYHAPVSCDGWVYRWIREEESISRLRGAGNVRPKPIMAIEESLT